MQSLGSLVPRYLFGPLQVISFSLFSKLSQVDSLQQRVEGQKVALVALFKIINVIGLFSFTFGIPFTHALLVLLFRERWSSDSANQTLRLYNAFIYFLGVNGILECFFNASISQKQIKTY